MPTLVPDSDEKVVNFPGTPSDQVDALDALRARCGAGSVRYFIAVEMETDGRIRWHACGVSSQVEQIGMLTLVANAIARGDVETVGVHDGKDA